MSKIGNKEEQKPNVMSRMVESHKKYPYVPYQPQMYVTSEESPIVILESTFWRI